jgi:TPR repeat protein
MSNVGEEEDERVGASCGKVGDIKSEADELHDRKLFTQPDSSHLGECPLCFLPLPLDRSKSVFWTCCSEIICDGCVLANFKSKSYDEVKAGRCPFCREPAKDDEIYKRMMIRVKANDPAASREMGVERYDEGNYNIALKYFTKAAELGDFDSHYRLGMMCHNGIGVEKDEGKKEYHFEKAAIGGHPVARHNLACIEEGNGNVERSVKHLIIAAKLGYDQSMKVLWTHFSRGNITKDDLDVTLRTHQAALDAMKSAQRDEAEVVWPKNH